MSFTLLDVIGMILKGQYASYSHKITMDFGTLPRIIHSGDEEDAANNGKYETEQYRGRKR